jgi:hypothetical protein
MSDLQARIARVLKDFAPTMPKPEIVWCADAIITELGLKPAPRTPQCRCSHPTTDHTQGWGSCQVCACNYFLWEDYDDDGGTP